MPSPFADIFPTYDLVFTVKTLQDDGAGNAVLDANEKPVYNDTPIPVRAVLEQTNRPSLRGLSGVEDTDIILIGHYSEPLFQPTELYPGVESPLTLGGDDGRFMLLPTVPDVQIIEDALGDLIVGHWRAKGSG